MNNELTRFVSFSCIVWAVLLVFLLSGCQDYRDAFNPIQILCPGDFDPVSNDCVVKTGGAQEE